MIYGLMAAWGAALLSLVWGLYQRWRARFSVELMADYLNVKAQRDRLNRENATLHEHLAEVGEQLQTTILEAHEMRMERDNEASENRALKLQLAEATKPRRRSKGQPVITEATE